MKLPDLTPGRQRQQLGIVHQQIGQAQGRASRRQHLMAVFRHAIPRIDPIDVFGTS